MEEELGTEGEGWSGLLRSMLTFLAPGRAGLWQQEQKLFIEGFLFFRL